MGICIYLFASAKWTAAPFFFLFFFFVHSFADVKDRTIVLLGNEKQVKTFYSSSQCLVCLFSHLSTLYQSFSASCLAAVFPLLSPAHYFQRKYSWTCHKSTSTKTDCRLNLQQHSKPFIHCRQAPASIDDPLESSFEVKIMILTVSP